MACTILMKAFFFLENSFRKKWTFLFLGREFGYLLTSKLDAVRTVSVWVGGRPRHAKQTHRATYTTTPALCSVSISLGSLLTKILSNSSTVC